MDSMMDVKEAATNLVRRPVDGCVITASGRCIPQPPWIIAEEPETAVAYDQWLIDQGREEAIALDENWMICRLAGLDGSLVDAALRHLLCDFLFGHPHPQFEARGEAVDLYRP
jgi:hypothetical protein